MCLDLILTNKEELVGHVKIRDSLGCSDHEMVKFRVLRGGDKANCRIATLDFRRADFGLFRDLLGRHLWDTVPEKRVYQQIWFIFKDHVLQASFSSLAHPVCRKSSKGVRRPAWMNEELLTKLKHKNEAHKRWKQIR